MKTIQELLFDFYNFANMSDQLETIGDYYWRVREDSKQMFQSDHFEVGKSHFNITMRKYCKGKSPYNRRDYYRVSLIIGKGTFQYGSQILEVDQPALFFPALNVPYSWTCGDNVQEGYFCLFNQEFFYEYADFNPFRKTALFKEWTSPIIPLTEEQAALAMMYFEQMYKVNQSGYAFRDDAIRSHLASVMHLALENTMEANEKGQEQSAGIRLYKLFDELLIKQFPLDSPSYPLQLKTASDYASALHVHVNHLNASVKAVTQQTTTHLIKEKIFEESKNLLKYTNWDVAEVGYTLGFEQPSHFTSFFKKHADMTPLKFRQQL